MLFLQGVYCKTRSPYVFDHDGEDVDELLDELVVIFAQFRHVRFGAGIFALSRRRLYNPRDRLSQLSCERKRWQFTGITKRLSLN